MHMSDNKIILPESDEAASIQTVTGWVSRRGFFHGPADSEEAERIARYDGSTHRKCDCGRIIDKNSYCHHCRAERELEKYNKMERREWNGTDGLYSLLVDEYFFDMDELMDYCDENASAPSDLCLVICAPAFAGEIDPNDHYQDELPEDGEVPDVVREAFKELNETLREAKAILSWYPGKYAAEIQP